MKRILLIAATRLLALAPVALLQAMSRPLGALVWRLSATRRGTTRRNLAACYPGLEEGRREILARESMRHFAQNALEIGLCWHGSRARLERYFLPPDGLSELEAARAHGKGVLLLTPHFGNWELLGLWLPERIRVMALYKAGSGSWIEDELKARRSRFGTEMAPTSAGGLKRIYRFLHESGTVIVLPDQDPADGRGRFAPFFGVPALTGVLALRLIQKTGCRAVFAACGRAPGYRYRAHFVPAAPALYSDNEEEALAALNHGVEQVVALDPPQYLWAYKRFKSRPEGEPPFYG